MAGQTVDGSNLADRVSPMEYESKKPDAMGDIRHDRSRNGSFYEIFNGAMCYERFIRRHLATTPCDFTRTELNILVSLMYNGPMSMTQLSDSLSISIAQASRTIKPLVEEGYVERSRMEGNRRIVMVNITEKGQEAQLEYQNRGFDNFEKMFSSLSETEIDTLARCCYEGGKIIEKAMGPQQPIFGSGLIED